MRKLTLIFTLLVIFASTDDIKITSPYVDEKLFDMYTDITIKKYKVDVYDRYSGKYLRSYYASKSTINGFKYVPQAA